MKSGITAQNIKGITREIPSAQEYIQIAEEMFTAHSRTVVIVLVSHIERYLEVAIMCAMSRKDESILKELISPHGPVNTFIAKIVLSYAMGLITDDQRHDLDVIRDIRNAFAHAPRPITFDTDEVSANVERLKHGTLPTDVVKSEGGDQNVHKLKFIRCYLELSSCLLRIAQLAFSRTEQPLTS